MNGDSIERLPQEGECRNEEECGILDAASKAAHRVLEEIEALAGTTAMTANTTQMDNMIFLMPLMEILTLPAVM